MTTRHTLLVVAHPRADSLTAQVAGHLHARVKDAGGTVDVLDLYAEGFDPRLTPADEPDREDREKRYSPEVHAHMDRIAAADEIVVVFPVWHGTELSGIPQALRPDHVRKVLAEAGAALTEGGDR